MTTARGWGHLFNNGDYCQLCGCGISFAPTEADLDFQICEGKRPDEEWADETQPHLQ